jgi:hypothetical protein
MNEKSKKILVAGSEFSTLHRGKKLRGKPGDGQTFDPADFTELRLASLLASGALVWQTVTLKTITPRETKTAGEGA